MAVTITHRAPLAGEKVQILLLEDEINVAKGLKLVLGEEGYLVDWAETGRRALNLFWSKRYDLLLADLLLPDMNGLEVVKEVKHHSPKTGVIVITGYSTVASAIETMKLGASDYLQKPFTEDEIKAAIRDALIPGVSPEGTTAPVKGPVQWMVQKREVNCILNRTTEDKDFWRALKDMRTDALEPYKLTPAARNAILSGDLQWLNENVGDLTQKQLTFIFQRVEHEVLLH